MLMKNLNDFCYILHGKCIRAVNQEDYLQLTAINQQRSGRSRALLLLHGFASSPAVFMPLSEIFSRYDAVVAPLLPGHLASLADFTTATANEWVQSAEHACAELVRQYAQVDVLGFSLGGVLASHISQIFPIHHLFLLAPAFTLKFNLRLAIAGAYVLRCLGVRTLRNRGGDIMSHEHAELTYRKLPLSTILEVLNLIRSSALMTPACATDLFLGRHDHVVNSSAIAKQCDGMHNMHLHWLENSAHVLPLDNDVQSIIRIIQLRLTQDLT